MGRTIDDIKGIISLMEKTYLEASGYPVSKERFKIVAKAHRDKLIDKFISGRIEHLLLQDAILLAEVLESSTKLESESVKDKTIKVEDVRNEGPRNVGGGRAKHSKNRSASHRS